MEVNLRKMIPLKMNFREFPGTVRTLKFHCWGHGFNPEPGN